MEPRHKEKRDTHLTEQYSLHVQSGQIVKSPLVSVLMWTYNHRAFIEQAIDSVFRQTLKYEWELIISDDCSTDGTTEIICDYQSRYPERIRLILSKINLWKEGRITERLLNLSRGDFIALHHGDDYWTDPQKLQMQVELLEKNPAITLVYHNVEYCYEAPVYSIVAFPSVKRPTVYPPPPMPTTFKDLLKGRSIPTLSAVFRRDCLPRDITWMRGLPVGDWPLFLSILKRGPALYVDRLMGVYRQHGDGIWSSVGAVRRQIGLIRTAAAVAQHFSLEPDERRELDHGVWIGVQQCVEQQLRDRQPGAALCVLREYIRKFPRVAFTNTYGLKLALRAIALSLNRE